MYVPRATYSFSMSFCVVPDKTEGYTLTAGNGDVQCEQDHRRRVDRHRRRHLVERDAVEQLSHVFDRIDRHPHTPDFAFGEA